MMPLTINFVNKEAQCRCIEQRSIYGIGDYSTNLLHALPCVNPFRQRNFACVCV